MNSILKITLTPPKELIFCNKLYTWLQKCDIKTHPIASLIALLTIASAITARKYYTHSMVSTTLFTILIAKTGAGKNTVVKAPSTVMKLLGQEEKIISSKISSEGAMDDIFKRQTVAIHILDEFGDQLGHMLGDTGGYLKVMASKMKSLYSLTNATYTSGRYSSAGGKQNIQKPWSLERPCYNLTGITTQAQLLSHLKETMLHDGFLNRFIILNGQNIKSQFNDFPENDLPEVLIKHLKSIEISNFNRTEDAEDNQENSKTPSVDYLQKEEQIIIPLAKDSIHYYSKVIGDADLKGTDIYNFCLDDESEIKRAISVRWRENTIRLATALCALEKLDNVPLAVLEWSYNLIKNSSINFISLFNESSVETKYEMLKKKAITWFKNQNSDEYISLTYLAINARPFSTLKSKDRRDLLDDLVETQVIESKVKQTNNTKEYLYKLIRN